MKLYVLILNENNNTLYKYYIYLYKVLSRQNEFNEYYNIKSNFYRSNK